MLTAIRRGENIMKREFNFGKVDFDGKGAVNLVTVEMEYKIKGEEKRFSACGNIWNDRCSDIICGGQCLDTISEYVKDPIFLQILRLWKMYHLNDMHPECTHQKMLGWTEKAKKKIKIYHWFLDEESRKLKEDAKTEAVEALKNGNTFTPTKEQSFYANLETFCTTSTPNSPKYYNINRISFSDKQKIDIKLLGHTFSTEHPEGLLGKPCPVCGYKYGTKWLYVPIPTEDEEIIYNLLKNNDV